jgi:GTP-binding protein
MALRAVDRPREWFPQVAVAGRSNVGKSSLLNWLFRRQLARVAKAPGKTRALSFYLVNGSRYLVDLPGYGYAKVERRLQEDWSRELGRYLATEERLAGVVSLIDIRRGPTDLDLELLRFLDECERPAVVVLTKADKEPRGRRRAMQMKVQRDLGLASAPLAVSVKTGEGRADLLRQIELLATTWSQHQQGE